MTHTHTDRRRSWAAFGVVGLTAGLLAAGAAAPAAAQEMPTGPAAREVEALACAPRAVTTPPAPLATIEGGVELKKQTFGAGDGIVLGSFGSEGLTVGSLYYLRRQMAPTVHGDGTDRWINLHTLGWARVERIEGGQAVATIVYSCDAVESGDYLAPFEVPTVPTPIPDSGEPDFDNAATVLFGPGRTSVGGAMGLLVIDRGADKGLRPGQMLTIFRRQGTGGLTQIIGEAMVEIALPDAATVRVTKASQPVYRGDQVAPRK